MKKNILIGQSGGPTAVINASLCGVITEALALSGDVGTVYGMKNGMQGFLKTDPVNLSASFRTEAGLKDLEYLKVTPGAYLGSCRFKMPEDISHPIYDKILEKLKQWSINIVLYIGGNDSMDTVHKLSEYIKSKRIEDISIIGIPKTIDNDLLGTDHTPGYGSAAKYVACTLRDIVSDSSVYDEPSVTIVELMGRHSGWLTAAGVIARKFKGDNPMLIYLPERVFDVEKFLSDIKEALKIRKQVVICVSEGIADSSGQFICEYENQAMHDQFGHKLLSSCSKVLERYVRAELNIKVRSVELNVSQRCSSSLLSATDVNEAFELGQKGLDLALGGASGKMVTMNRYSNQPYCISYGSLDSGQICNKERRFPEEWICNDRADITDDFFPYVFPLIQGRVTRDEQALPVFTWLNKDICQT